jgi:hypothetical protein
VGGSPASLLAPWHEFFALVGAASATLIGAMFVVVSLGVGVLTRDRIVAVRAFITSTVTHLSSALLGCALTLVPALDWVWLALAAGLAGIGGIAYSGWVLAGFRQHRGTVLSDWLWYAILPLLAYAALLVVAGAAYHGVPASLGLLAAILAFLLIAGIRNAWDMVVFLVLQARDSTS